MLYQYTIYPLECVYKMLYLFLAEVLGHYGFALIALSMLVSVIIYPFMQWTEKLQKKEKRLQDVIKPQLDIIKKESKGEEQYQRIQRLYKRYGYHPVMAIRSAFGVILQTPFLMAAYYMLSKLPEIQGMTWGIVQDLGKPDALLLGYNVFPFVMTVVNLLGAYTTKGFSKRDRLQAIGIAGLFLVLLYNAPSALLIFWTCNNLWVLLGNVKDIIFEKNDITMPSILIKGKSLSEWVFDIPDAIFVCLGLSATVCVLVPTDVYLVNTNELWFTLPDILKYLLLGAVVLIVVLSVVYFVLPNRRLKAIYTAIVLGLLLGFFLQSYVINLDYGILDGRTIKWDTLKKEAVLNCLAWGTCIVAPLLGLQHLKEERFITMAKKIALFLAAVQLCSAFYVAGTGGNIKLKVTDNIILTTEGEFAVSSKDNIIVFVLDAFESKTFREIQKKNPELVKQLEGFIYYPDAESFFGYTDYSLPQMLTNKVFDNQGSYKDYLKSAWEETEFYKYLKEKDYDIRLFTFSTFLYGAEGQIDNLEKAKYVIDRSTFKSFMKLSLFREMPHVLKKHFVIYSGILSNPSTVSTQKAYKENDIAYYNELKNGLKIVDNKNCFRFYHLKGAHKPYTMSANIERLKKGEKGTLYNQAVGSLKIALEYIRQMKEKKIYNAATFVILADHGKGNSIVTGPLVLVKQPDAPKVPLITKHNAISYKGLQATLLQRYTGTDKIFGANFSKMNEKVREFSVIKNEQKSISFVQYEIKGNTENKNSWKKKRIKKSTQSNTDSTYDLGSEIDFSPLGNSSKYVVSGWSQTVDKHRWINKKQAACELLLKDYSGGKLTLCVLGEPSLLDEAKHRDVSVYVNGSKLCTWKTLKYGEYRIAIPDNLIKTNKLNIMFQIENPVPSKIDGGFKQFRVLSMRIKR